MANKDLTLEEDNPDSLLVYMRWRAITQRPGVHRALAMQYWTFLFSDVNRRKSVTLHRPHVTAQYLDYKQGTYWGVLLNVHVFMPNMIKNNIPFEGCELPVEGDYFYLEKQKLRIPDYDDVVDFVEELHQRGLIVTDELVVKALENRAHMSPRTIQRRMTYVAGITRKELEMIRKARRAYGLLQEGFPITQVVDQAGYTDQAHLTKSLKLLAGQTPAQILAANKASEN